MAMPKFKATDWKIKYCLQCKANIGRYSCKDHSIIERDNVPFLISEMQILRFGKWSTLHATKEDKSFLILRSKMAKIIMGCGVEPGGYIRNQWWMWSKVGGSLSLAWVPQDE